MAARVAGDAVRPRLDDPGLPARARRPELHAGADADLPRDDGGPPHPALGPLPRLRDRHAEPARVRQRRAEGARTGRDTRRHDLVHRHERTERRLRPRRPADARRGVRRPLRRERAEGVDVVRDRSRRSASATCAPTRPSPKHRGISLLIIDMDTPGIDVRPLRTSRARPTSPRCSSPTSSCRARTSSASCNGGWAITQGSLAHERAGLWVEGVARFEQTVDALVDARAPHRPRATIPIVRRKIAQTYELASSLRVARLPGLRVVRAGLVGARALVHEDGDLGSGQGRVRARHGDLRTVRRGHRRRARRGSRPLGARASSCRSPTRSRAARPRSSATSSPSACSASPGPDPTTDGLHPHRRPAAAARHRAQAARQGVPARARARAHRRPRGVRTAVGAPPRVHRARPRPRDRPRASSSRRPATSPRPDRSSRRALFASLTGEEATGTVAIAGASGAWTPNDDPVKTFVLEADRVERIAIVGAGPTPRRRRRARPRPRCASSRRSTSRAASSSSTPTRSR